MSERIEYRGNVHQWMIALLVENAYCFRTAPADSVKSIVRNVRFIETFFRFP